MPSLNWRDILANRDRRQFPEVVVPLESAPLKPKNDIHDSDNTQDAASLQEKGATAGHGHMTLTLEVLRAEILAETASSGHNTAYDRKFETHSPTTQSIWRQIGGSL